MDATDRTPGPVQGPDIMNDPAFDGNTKKQEKGIEEADTCRICRGEGSNEEPLFYPCKCSGSIKFVHQSCLMEWLSHSQKKHCELCKTPFRFTKLYHPQMPTTVPLPIFLRQVVLNIFNSILTWARWQLVAFVWLGWVPWCMRTVWRGLFWIGDGAWINWKVIEKQSAMAATRRLNTLATPQPTAVALESLISSNFKDFSIASRLFRKLPAVLRPISQTLNFTAEPTMVKGIRSIIKHFQLPHLYDPLTVESSNQNRTSDFILADRSPSLLSDITFLTSLTRWKTLNNIVIDILEGQLITLSICVAFILIFLIREWVVQQAPGINMGAAIDAAVVAQPQPPPVPQLQLLARQHAEQELGDAMRDAPARIRDEVPAMNEHLKDTETQGDILEDRFKQLSGSQSEQSMLPSDSSPSADPKQPESREDKTSSSHMEPSNWERQQAVQGSTDAEESDSLDDENMQLAKASPETIGAAQKRIEVAQNKQDNDDESEELEKLSPEAVAFLECWGRPESSHRKDITLLRSDDRADEPGLVMRHMTRRQQQRSQKSSSVIDAKEREEDAAIEQASDGSNESWQVVSDDTARPLNSEDKPVHTDVNTFTKSLNDNIVRPSNGKRSGDPAAHHSSSASPAPSSIPNKGKERENAGLPEVSKRFPTNNENLVSEASSDSPAVWPPSPPLTPQPQSGFDRAQPPLADNRAPSPSHTSPSMDVIAAESSARSQNESITQPPVAQHPVQGNISEKILDWLWGGVTQGTALVEEQPGNEERVVENLANEAPFVPVANGQPLLEIGNNLADNGQDPEVVRAAVEAGINPNEAEVIEEGEDLEGILELLGIQGPIAGLIQNGIFSAILISVTVFLGIWVPYIAGKMVLVFLANPVSLLIKLPLRWASSLADFVIDSFIFVVAFVLYWIDNFAQLVIWPLGWAIPWLRQRQEGRIVAMLSLRFAQNALQRLEKMFIVTGDTLSDSDIPAFSIIAHESLHNIEQKATNLTAASMDRTLIFFRTLSSEDFKVLDGLRLVLSTFVGHMHAVIENVPLKIRSAIASITSVTSFNPLSLTLSIPHRTNPLDYNLAEWSTRDRVSAIVLGYMAFSLAGFVYIKVRTAFRDARANDKPEGTVINILFQAGGIMKVILIISIEMIVFPLYCGLLLDFALLPLFENRSLVSRMAFTFRSPATSLFVHWFIGTCYMFHFALFVSMCRKIMRSGVLYFIRDPDDPTFHPVRDVLERNVTTQLRKIAFSAMVYGALVVVCLGGVVWGLSYAIPSVFPIHWSSNEPVLEFPVDLLVYNFLMPVAIKFFRPSSGLNRMYGWWFRKCSRMLRLTEFMFGERKEDEEGHRPYMAWIRFWNKRYKPFQLEKETTSERSSSNAFQQSPDFIHDGIYVRAPASDQVRIPKGARTFVRVTPNNTRIDGLPDSIHGLHGKDNKGFTKLYIPPYFRLRIGIFIVLIWLFAAATGVGITVIPLVWGRFLFSTLAPSHLRMNDIYAFAIGIYTLGGPVYVGLRYKAAVLQSYQSVRQHARRRLSGYLSEMLSRAVRLAYLYGSLTLLMPSLFALLMELYLLIPLHTYFSTLPSQTTSAASPSLSPTNLPARHTVHFIQDWTLGVLYVKSAIRLILWYNNSRPAHALRAIVAGPRHGWLNPDVRLATRAFIFPVTVLSILLLTIPLGLGWSASRLLSFAGSVPGGERTKWTEDQVFQACIYRYAYPGVLGLCFGFVAAKRLAKGVSRWRDRARDEVYLIGERLHNFGEGRGAGAGNGVRRARAVTN